MLDSTQQHTALTCTQWADALANQIEPGDDPLIRREHERFYVVASARLTPIVNGKPCQDDEQTCALLDVSESGIMVRTRMPIAADTPVDVVVYLGDGEYPLVGRVVHCTSTVGANKVGVRLELPTDEPAEAHARE